MKKIVAFFMVMSLSIISLISCSSGDGSGDGGMTGDTSAASSSQSSDAGDGSVVPSWEDKYDVPDIKYDGHEYLILTAGNVAYDDFSFDQSSSIVLDNAQYQRKVTVETKFDVDILIEKAQSGSSFGEGPGYRKVSQAVGSNDCVYELSLMGTYDAASLAMSNCLYDLNSVEHIELRNSWWDQDANNDLLINGLMFFTVGDLSVGNNNATFTLVFNKKIAKTIQGMKDPYQLVTDMKWTYDELKAMSKTVSEDINGDDVMDMRDKYGMIVWDDSVMASVNSVGSRVCTINADGEVLLSFNNERTLNAFLKWTEMTYDRETAIYNQRHGSANGNVNDMWRGDRALFRNCLINTVHSMRAMESDFGILPYPMLDESQGRYYSTLAPYNGQFICIPLIQDDIERAGIIAESLAYYGREIVRPAFYEKTLYGGIIRDEESAAMLDIILSSYIFDLGWYYQIGGYNEGLMDLCREYSSGFASMYASTESSAQEKLDTLNGHFRDVFEYWDDLKNR